MAVQPPPPSMWEDVSPSSGRGGGRGVLNAWHRTGRQPLQGLDDALNATLRLPHGGAGNPSSKAPECSQVAPPSADGIVQPPFVEVTEAAGNPARVNSAEWQQQQHQHQQQQQQEGEEGVTERGGQAGGVAVAVSGAGQRGDGIVVVVEEDDEEGNNHDDFNRDYADVLELPSDMGVRRGRVKGKDEDRVRDFHNMICVGFAVALCLNLGSLTARNEGFFAAEVKCLSPGASEIVLSDLGVWVGWRGAVANAHEETSFNLEELSMTGATMGILTVVGHATDSVVNAAGLALLLWARRKPLEKVHLRVVKRLCLASFAMAGWLMGMTVIGFLAAVKGPIGSAAVAFYSQRFHLKCGHSVSVSVDYAYAMTTLTVLCQFFIGIVALPRPPSCRPKCCGWMKICRSSTAPADPQEFRRRGGRSSRSRSRRENAERRKRSNGVKRGERGDVGGLDASMVRNSVGDPV